MWRNLKFLHMPNEEDSEMTPCYIGSFQNSPHLAYEEISDFSTFVMYRNLKFLNMTNFSPHVSFVNFVTNMRYADIVAYFLWFQLPKHFSGQQPIKGWWKDCLMRQLASTRMPSPGEAIIFIICNMAMVVPDSDNVCDKYRLV